MIITTKFFIPKRKLNTARFAQKKTIIYKLFKAYYYMNEKCHWIINTDFFNFLGQISFADIWYVTIICCWLTNQLKSQWLKQTFIITSHESAGCGFADIIWAPSGFCGASGSCICSQAGGFTQGWLGQSSLLG